jgi:hypothetical protein
VYLEDALDVIQDLDIVKDARHCLQKVLELGVLARLQVQVR